MRIRAFPIIVLVVVVLIAHQSAAAELPKCHEEETSLPDGWQQIQALGEDITFALPPDITLAEPQPKFMHGGTLWAKPGLTVTLMYGMWGMSSFNVEGANRVCQTQISGIPVVLVVRSGKNGNNMTAWMQTKAEPYEPVLSIDFADWDDIAVARHVIGSAQRSSTR